MYVQMYIDTYMCMYVHNHQPFVVWTLWPNKICFPRPKIKKVHNKENIEGCELPYTHIHTYIHIYICTYLCN